MKYDYKGKKIELNDELVKIWERVVHDEVCDRVIDLALSAKGLEGKKVSGKKLSDAVTSMMKTDLEVFGFEPPAEV